MTLLEHADDEGRVAKVLWEIWDPIGVRNMGFPADEYDSYVSDVLQLLMAGAGEDELTEHLLRIETERMGLEGGLRSRDAAGALLALGIRRR